MWRNAERKERERANAAEQREAEAMQYAFKFQEAERELGEWRDRALSERVKRAAADCELAERDAALSLHHEASEHIAALNIRLSDATLDRQAARHLAWEQAERTAKECDDKVYFVNELFRVEDERDRLAARIAEAESQEPVAWMWVEDGVMHEPSLTRFAGKREDAPSGAVPLYASPVATITQAEHAATFELMQRCANALRRHIDGYAPIRIPADPSGDSDLVLADVEQWLRDKEGA